MYKGRFDKKGSRSVADILQERAAQSPAAPHMNAPAPSQEEEILKNLNFHRPADPEAPVIPQASVPGMPEAAEPVLPESPAFFREPVAQRPMNPQQPGMPQRPMNPQQNGMPQRPMNPQQNGMPQRPMNPQQNGMPQRPMNPQQNGMPQRPMNPQQNGMPQRPMNPQQNGMPQRPMNPQQNGMPQRPVNPQQNGMPQRPMNSQHPGMPQRPMNPQHPGMPQRPMNPQQPGMPQRPMNPQHPGMPQRPVNPQHPGMPQRPVNPQQPGMAPRPGQVPQGSGTVLGPGGMPIRPGYHPQAGGPGGTPPRKPPVPKKQAPAAPAPDPRRKNTITFYISYFAFIFVFFVITFFGLTWLKGWLTDYEAAQPYTMAEKIFQANFAQPNWKIIYQNSTSYLTNPQDCDTFVKTMEEKVGSSPLTYQETSAGLSGDRKYFIKLGDESIASFTLVGDSKYITDIPDWTLGEIEVLVKYDNSYRIQMLEGHTAYVNGKALDESYTIMKASTMAQEFLPVGTKGIRMWTQEVNNLMGKPEVVIKDEKGKEMEVLFDEETNTFIEQTEANTMSDEQRDAAIGATKVYARYMIAQAGRGELAKFFDASSKVYSTIRDSEKIVQQSFFSSYDFGTPEILNFCMYSDDHFSARVAVALNVTRKDGTVKTFDVENTLFFSQHSTGKWLAYDMTNEDVQKPIGQVRLTFQNTDGTLIASDFYDTNATELDTPMITVPQGKVFSGWVRQSVSEEGKTVLEVMFTPDETGHVVLSSGFTLEPMILTPLFETENPEGGNE